ncbi:uncharacterized protein LOC123870988 [Maniola jurtina]|uniref:uncharacterized protein LOC123870988 n=1 Tax=Maniola jurtina TaxID=191418 RepID=UPI001E68961C|nr:uncharacterized protein LOC123870988 [Maniola jurtina]
METRRHRHASAHTAQITSGVDSSSDEDYRTPPSSTGSADDTRPPRRAPRRRATHPPPDGLEQQELRAPTTASAASGVVRRMRWTQRMNENVMRAYYRATDGGTNLTGYRSRMVSLFQALEPTVTVSAQRLSDQVRVIQRRRVLDESTLDRLRLNLPQVITTGNSTHKSPQIPSVIEILNTQEELQGGLDLAVSNQNDEQMRRTLEDAILEFRSVPNNLRPKLPRLPVHRRNMALMAVLDKILGTYLESSYDLNDTHSILYCGAVAACRIASIKFPELHRAVKRPNTAPAWQAGIERRISLTRTLIAKLICFRAGNSRPRIMRFVHQAFAGTNISPSQYLSLVTDRIDFLKQKVYAWAQRIRRFRKRIDRASQNRMFQSDQRKMYRNWERPRGCMVDGELPTPDSTSDFWRSIWSAPIDHTEGEWMNVVRDQCATVVEMNPVTISAEDVGCAIRSASNWKCPGPDGLHNFWLKWFRSAHPVLATQFQNSIDSGSLPTLMTTGVTFLIHKSGSTADPKNYRPITCLPTIYKLLTSILTTKITMHINANNILAQVQNGCKARARGTKELLLIDTAICQQVRRNRKNLVAAWIDYKKAYDSVPHTWLMEIMRLYKVDATLCSFLDSCMSQWMTVLRQPGGDEFFESAEPIRIKRGIFQGDSLSPLWFCLALNPLSTLLKDSGLGYRLRKGGEVISHLLYMDDLKLYASKRTDLVKLLKITQNFSNNIGMEFGVDKCAIINIERDVKLFIANNAQSCRSVPVADML